MLGGTMANWARAATSVLVGNRYMVMFRSIQLLNEFGIRTTFVFFNSTVFCPVRSKEHKTSQ